MKAYLICFIFTIIFTYIAEKNYKNNKKTIAIIASIIAIFIPSYIAGVRAIGVGRDIENYVQPVINRAVNSGDFATFFQQTNYVETGYKIFIYLITRFSCELPMSLFMIQLIPCFCVYIFAVKNRNRVSMTMVMCTYLLVWYTRSLTIMRQSISIALILISTIFFNKKQYTKSILLFILSVLFHSSTVLSIGIFIVIYIFNNEKFSQNQKIFFGIILMLVLTLLVACYSQAIKVISNVFGLKYISYTMDDSFSKDYLMTSYSEIIVRVIAVGLVTFAMIINARKKENKKDSEFSKYYMLLLIDMVLYFISLKIANAERIGYYYRYIGMLYCMAAIPKIFNRRSYNTVIVNLLIIGYLFGFWYWKYPIQKNCESCPYYSTEVEWLNEK